jgi:cytochrome c peroxidase
MRARRYMTLLASTLLLAMTTSCGPMDEEPEPDPDLTLDEKLELAIDEHDLEPLAEAPPQDPARVDLGRALFYDKILSGNRDTSCASCHHPREMTADEQPLSAGTGAIIEGTERRLGPHREFTPRQSTDIFNRGVPAWGTMFWDMRIRTTDDGRLLTPAGSRLPDGLDSPLEAQAMFPVTSRDEMRGEPWDTDVFGEPNELGEIVDGLVNQIWDALMVRLLDIDEYRELFAQAYPDVDVDELGFEHAAKALAAYQIDAFSFTDSPWDRYLAGQRDALDEPQKRGAALFYGEAGCVDCHSGSLFTDQKPHNLAVPQMGPGKSPDEPLDLGFGRVSNNPAHDFAFRTPPLRNVALTAPYMHNGAYPTLEGAIRHHLSAAQSLRDYDPNLLDDVFAELCLEDDELNERIISTLDPKMKDPPELDDDEIAELIAFLEALTAAGADNTVHEVPDRVPSGLPLD